MEVVVKLILVLFIPLLAYALQTKGEEVSINVHLGIVKCVQASSGGSTCEDIADQIFRPVSFALRKFDEQNFGASQDLQAPFSQHEYKATITIMKSIFQHKVAYAVQVGLTSLTGETLPSVTQYLGGAQVEDLKKLNEVFLFGTPVSDGTTTWLPIVEFSAPPAAATSHLRLAQVAYMLGK